ncbi:monosaccharide ABC transporter membrane protein, CUT2 family [Anaerocolumna jejuensis DSM 15929]|uniref:Autoinducer 2 import system permease protein LsrD n=1 Tax=Anaerocolumna jejuensis DSM 15929 TaxID=1121322 RepID=A0A1M6W972_9FIRM|nr:ABC transporter permease [Anaerocolumna jejuensis]SHK90056.1 monosaccharide ABC transporter membrane protein, CUT2 family [Anaerocolumna jejuensis DSM 15929]
MGKMQQSAKNGILGKIRSFKEFNVLMVTIILIIGISIKSPIFLSATNIRTTLIGLACNGIIAIGMTLALVSGGFDLSVGAIMGLSACLTVVFAGMGLNVWFAAILALIVCIGVGLLTGTLIGRVGLNPFITTLGIQQIARGAVFVLTAGSSLSLPAGADISSFKKLGQSSILGIPIIVVIFIIMAVLGDFLVKKSSAAMKVFYIGSNEKAAILSGINAKKVKQMVYIITATLAAVAGILTSARFGVATSNTGAGSEMTVISAAVIGGASLTGGKGTILGAVVGVIMLSVISNALVLFNVDVNWQSLISGAILILAILFDLLSHKRKYKA